MGLVIKLAPKSSVTIGENIKIKNLGASSATILFEAPKDVEIKWERLPNEKDKSAKRGYQNV